MVEVAIERIVIEAVVPELGDTVIWARSIGMAIERKVVPKGAADL
jgi:hypothetical protein